MTPYRSQIETAAKAYWLDPNVVEAVVLTESSGHTDAFRFEPDFWTRYLKDKPEYASAIPRRVSSSYGLMQVMYTTACERGYRGEPEILFVPHINLAYGCKHLAHLVQWAGGNIDKALAAYNAGKGNWDSLAGQAYAARVRRHLTQILAEQK